MMQWAVDEKDEFIDEGPKIGQYDSPNLTVPDSKKDKSLTKKASQMSMKPSDSKSKLKKDDSEIQI